MLARGPARDEAKSSNDTGAVVQRYTKEDEAPPPMPKQDDMDPATDGAVGGKDYGKAPSETPADEASTSTDAAIGSPEEFAASFSAALDQGWSASSLTSAIAIGAEWEAAHPGSIQPGVLTALRTIDAHLSGVRRLDPETFNANVAREWHSRGRLSADVIEDAIRAPTIIGFSAFVPALSTSHYGGVRRIGRRLDASVRFAIDNLAALAGIVRLPVSMDCRSWRSRFTQELEAAYRDGTIETTMLEWRMRLASANVTLSAIQPLQSGSSSILLEIGETLRDNLALARTLEPVYQAFVRLTGRGILELLPEPLDRIDAQLSALLDSGGDVGEFVLAGGRNLFELLSAQTVFELTGAATGVSVLGTIGDDLGTLADVAEAGFRQPLPSSMRRAYASGLRERFEASMSEAWAEGDVLATSSSNLTYLDEISRSFVPAETFGLPSLERLSALVTDNQELAATCSPALQALIDAGSVVYRVPGLATRFESERAEPAQGAFRARWRETFGQILQKCPRAAALLDVTGVPALQAIAADLFDAIQFATDHLADVQ